MNKDKKAAMIYLWEGTHINELEKPELINALEYCGAEIRRLDDENRRLLKSCDPLKYFMNY